MADLEAARQRDFNPRSREGSDPCHRLHCCLFSISIHAPARGATGTVRSLSMQTINFNPRSREGSDPVDMINAEPFLQFQSTLPRGERHAETYGRLQDMVFQSTLPRGERHCVGTGKVRAFIFQSTLPRGERQRMQHDQAETYNFNPRSREGSDGDAVGDDCITDHFNPRSREGSDYNKSIEQNLSGISIHAPARGATAAVFY